MPIFHIEYVSNNSGGDWWLKDLDWLALEESGWCVHWVRDVPEKGRFLGKSPDGKFLGANATSACKDFEANFEYLAEEYAALDWESSVAQNSLEEGCSCCGRPHSFYGHKKENCNCTYYYGSK